MPTAIPTHLPPEYLQFSLSITLANVLSSSLNSAAQNAVIKMESIVFGIPAGDIIFLGSSNSLPTLKHQRIYEEDTFSLIVVTFLRTIIDASKLKGDSTTVEEYYSKLSYAAIQNGTMTTILQQQSVLTGSNTTLFTSVTKADISSFQLSNVSTLIPSFYPSIYPASGSADNTSIEVVVGLSIGILVIGIVTAFLILRGRNILRGLPSCLSLAFRGFRRTQYSLPAKKSRAIYPVDESDNEAKVDENEIDLHFHDLHDKDDDSFAIKNVSNPIALF